MRIVLALLVSGLLSGASCLPRPVALPDPRVPHRVATETTVEVWVRRPDRTLVRARVRVLPGWWIAAPEVVEGPRP